MTTWAITHQPAGDLTIGGSDSVTGALAGIAAAAGRTINKTPAPGRIVIEIDKQTAATLSIGTNPTTELATLADTIAQLAADLTDQEQTR